MTKVLPFRPVDRTGLNSPMAKRLALALLRLLRRPPVKVLGLLLLLGCGEIAEPAVPHSVALEYCGYDAEPCGEPTIPITLTTNVEYDTRRLPFYPPSVFPVTPDSVVFTATADGASQIVTTLQLDFGYGLRETISISEYTGASHEVLKLGNPLVEAIWTVRAYQGTEEVAASSRTWRLPQPWPTPSSPCNPALATWSYNGTSYIRAYCA